MKLDDIKRASGVIKDHVIQTPLIESSLLNERLGGRLLFKAECLQKTGSFKIRGASNKILKLSPEQQRRGIVAYSSGNHAQGVAAAAKSAGISAKIVIPKDAPALKIANTRAYGAEVILYDRYSENREAIANDISEKEGRTIIPPYDDLDIIAGQGTIGLEIFDQLKEAGIAADAVLCPCGGGGLVSGVATALSALSPEVEIFAVEPDGLDDTRRSLEAGERLANDPNSRSICDSIVTPIPGKVTFGINQRLLQGGLSVSDESVTKALIEAFRSLKLVIEPGAAVGLAAAMSGAYPIKGKTAVIILSGGNVDLETVVSISQPNAV